MKLLSQKPIAVASLAIIFVGALCFFVFGPVSSSTSVPAPDIKESSSTPVRAILSASKPPSDAASATAGTPAEALMAKMRDFSLQFPALRAKHNGLVTLEFREAAEKLFASMINELRAAPREVQTQAIMRYLDAHDDASTGMNFVVGEGGLLTEAPSIRTAMLNVLAQTDPAKSVDYARKVLAESQSPDEWALALRNLAMTNTGGEHTEELRQAFKKMIDQPAWLEKAAPGFMQAFDVAAALGGKQEFEELASLVNLENSFGLRVENGVSAAAEHALDRMAFINPGPIVQQIASNAETLSWAPNVRAALMGRANVSDAAQRGAVEAYLQRSDLTAEELTAFAEKFGGTTLITDYPLVAGTGPGVDYQQQVNGKKAALAAAKQWQQDPRFHARQVELQHIVERLEILH